MTTRLTAHTVPPVGAYLFAWHLAGRHLRGGYIPQGGLIRRRSSYVPRGLIARGPANEFAPTKAAEAVRKLPGWRKKPREYPARAIRQGLLP